VLAASEAFVDVPVDLVDVPVDLVEVPVDLVEVPVEAPVDAPAVGDGLVAGVGAGLVDSVGGLLGPLPPHGAVVEVLAGVFDAEADADADADAVEVAAPLDVPCDALELADWLVLGLLDGVGLGEVLAVGVEEAVAVVVAGTQLGLGVGLIWLAVAVA
jgi:hypothetical protein